MCEWNDLKRITVCKPSVVNLRHNKHAHATMDMFQGESLDEVLLALHERCRRMVKANVKIRGIKKLLEHTTLNNCSLLILVERTLRGQDTGRLVFKP